MKVQRTLRLSGRPTDADVNLTGDYIKIRFIKDFNSCHDIDLVINKGKTLSYSTHKFGNDVMMIRLMKCQIKLIL